MIASLGRRTASLCYGAGARLHRVFMRRTSGGRGRPACAVVSVGGLTVGGAGKTPFAARLARALHERGWRVVLASAGYKGRSRDPVRIVSDGVFIRSDAGLSGDESYVLAAHAPGVPVLVGKDRRIVGHRAVSLFDAEILVLDDGFQHHRLARDLDLVCIDGVSGLGNGRVLPAGPLREPLSALRHADWLCMIDAEEGRGGGRPPEGGSGASPDPGIRDPTLPDTISARLERFDLASHRIVKARRRPLELLRLGRSDRRALGTLRGLRVGLISGIARPGSFRRTVESLGAEVVVERCFEDHHVYSMQDLEGLGHAGVDLWITTEKDAVKILPDWLGGRSLWVLVIEMEIEREGGFLDRIEAGLRGKGRLAERPTRTP
ncbi:MAG TPA: tetraacyldisaccharide 4'-kinase [Deltaproteobacteria bacterium]|nr:tetraacyldisaccharide 4'-kinase [Deltaproteobacteria bacterium]